MCVCELLNQFPVLSMWKRQDLEDVAWWMISSTFVLFCSHAIIFVYKL